MNRRADHRRRLPKLRLETFRVLDAAELDRVVGGDRGGGGGGGDDDDGVYKVFVNDQRGRSRYCND